jgi:hypothetical protein
MIAAGLAHRRLILSRGFEIRSRAKPSVQFLGTTSLPADQPVTVLTDGGDSVRALVGDLPAGSEHQLDWFHVAMRMTVLGQYAKGLAHHNPLEATALQDRLERIKWRLWHGDASGALNRARELAEDVAALSSGYPGLARLVKATAGLVTYIANNVAAIADYAQRWDHGEIISTAFAESTVDLVVSQRFAKKQQMQWSKKGAHLLLQPAPSTARCTTCSPAGIRSCQPTMSSPPHSLPQPGMLRNAQEFVLTVSEV